MTAASAPLVPRAALALYRFAGWAAMPLLRRHLKRRAERGREDANRMGERFGKASLVRPPGPLIWLHASSVGESLSVLSLVQRIQDGWPKITVLLTTGTATSARLMAERLPKGVIHQYVPVDLKSAADAFLDHWRPSLALPVESEFWPNLIVGAAERGCNLVLVNGRISAASVTSWGRVRPIFGYLLDQFAEILAQSPEDLSHFQSLGATQARFLGNLKNAAAPLEADAHELATLRARLGDRPIWLAASTHPGEEEIIARVHNRLDQDFRGLVTVIVPRHPDRGPEIAALLRQQGSTVALRSAGDSLPEASGIYLADSIGELGLWYRLAEVAWIGKSFVPKGGQNPLEAAKLGCAILRGPHCANFLRITQEMESAGAMQRVTDGAELTEAVANLIRDDARRRRMIAAAKDYADAQADVLERFVEALKPHLDRVLGASPKRAA